MPDDTTSPAGVATTLPLGCDFCKRPGRLVQYGRSDGIWHITCTRCDPLKGSETAYWWLCSELTTPAEVRRFIDHVSGKRWIVLTDWPLMEARLMRAAGL